jgi:hypothetical protein
MKNIFLLLLIIISLTACSSDDGLESRIMKIGNNLCEIAVEGKARNLYRSRTVQDVVRVGKGLSIRLDEISHSLKNGYEVNVKKGDAKPPIGDNKASHLLFISSQGKNLVGLRLLFDQKIDEFLILGYWTPKGNL